MIEAVLTSAQMGSLSTEISNVEKEGSHLHVGDEGRAGKHQWLLDCPEPPSMWHEIISCLKEAFDPRSNKPSSSSSSSSSGEQKVSPRVVSVLRSVFPILSWGRNYNASKFRSDLMAGLTLASLSIPQSIGYANLANLDPQYGLYTSVVPPLIYALLGSSKELAIGPVAVVSLLLSSMLQKIQDPHADPTAYRKLVFTVTFFAGSFQAAFGLFRLGFLVNFLSHAAIVGFMGGAAIVIGLQQLKGLLGIAHFSTSTDIISVLHSVLQSFHHSWYPLNFVLGCSFFIFLLLARFIGRRNRKLFWLPAIAPLLSVILSTLIVFLTKADKHGVKIVKHIDRSVNPSSVHQLQLHGPHTGQAAKIGLISALIALTEAIAVGRSFASINGYRLDGNKEMVAMGFMNIAGSFTSCYVATGSFSRTAVNFSAGCETVVSNIVMAITVLVSLELFTRFLYYTPMAILASIILSALPGLIDLNEAYHIWKVDRLDFLACLGAFLGVLFVSVEIGLLAAVSISFAKILLNFIRPDIDLVGRLPTTDIFCDVRQYPAAEKIQGTVVIRINTGFLCFANANFIRDKVLRWITEEQNDNEDFNAFENGKEYIKEVVLDIASVMNVDTSGIIALEELHMKLISTGIKLNIANPRWDVIHKLKMVNFIDRIEGKVFESIAEAIQACSSSKFPT